MQNFFYVETPYLMISVFILAVFVFVATRPFVSVLLLKRGLPILVVLLSVGIGFHYVSTESRAEEVKKGFNDGYIIFCSERRSKSGDRNIEVSKGDMWRLEGDFFVNSEGNKFSVRQCVVSNNEIGL
jgi:hypothetical protein